MSIKKEELRSVVDAVVAALRPYLDETITRQIHGQVRHVVYNELRDEIGATVRSMVKESVSVEAVVSLKEGK